MLRRFLHKLRVLIPVFIIVLLQACTTVPAYQRSKIMRRAMEGKPALDQAFYLHVMDLREAAFGASGEGGASCGCR